MCLTAVTRRCNKPNPSIRTGYKVVRMHHYRTAPSTFSLPFVTSGEQRRFNKWYRARVTVLCPNDKKRRYNSGFHILTVRAVADHIAAKEGLSAVRVQYRNVTVYGYQYSCPCVVAREMRVLTS